MNIDDNDEHAERVKEVSRQVQDGILNPSAVTSDLVQDRIEDKIEDDNEQFLEQNMEDRAEYFPIYEMDESMLDLPVDLPYNTNREYNYEGRHQFYKQDASAVPETQHMIIFKDVAVKLARMEKRAEGALNSKESFKKFENDLHMVRKGLELTKNARGWRVSVARNKAIADMMHVLQLANLKSKVNASALQQATAQLKPYSGSNKPVRGPTILSKAKNQYKRLPEDKVPVSRKMTNVEINAWVDRLDQDEIEFFHDTVERRARTPDKPPKEYKRKTKAFFSGRDKLVDGLARLTSQRAAFTDVTKALILNPHVQKRLLFEKQQRQRIKRLNNPLFVANLKSGREKLFAVSSKVRREKSSDYFSKNNFAELAYNIIVRNRNRQTEGYSNQVDLDRRRFDIDDPGYRPHWYPDNSRRPSLRTDLLRVPATMQGTAYTKLVAPSASRVVVPFGVQDRELDYVRNINRQIVPFNIGTPYADVNRGKKAARLDERGADIRRELAEARRVLRRQEAITMRRAIGPPLPAAMIPSILNPYKKKPKTSREESYADTIRESLKAYAESERVNRREVELANRRMSSYPNWDRPHIDNEDPYDRGTLSSRYYVPTLDEVLAHNKWITDRDRGFFYPAPPHVFRDSDRPTPLMPAHMQGVQRSVPPVLSPVNPYRRNSPLVLRSALPPPLELPPANEEFENVTMDEIAQLEPDEFQYLQDMDIELGDLPIPDAHDLRRLRAASKIKTSLRAYTSRNKNARKNAPVRDGVYEGFVPTDFVYPNKRTGVTEHLHTSQKAKALQSFMKNVMVSARAEKADMDKTKVVMIRKMAKRLKLPLSHVFHVFQFGKYPSRFVSSKERQTTMNDFWKLNAQYQITQDLLPAYRPVAGPSRLRSRNKYTYDRDLAWIRSTPARLERFRQDGKEITKPVLQTLYKDFRAAVDSKDQYNAKLGRLFRVLELAGTRPLPQLVALYCTGDFSGTKNQMQQRRLIAATVKEGLDMVNE